MNITRKDATITPLGSDEDFPGQFRVILSAPTLDRDGDTLLPDEWKQPLPDHITFDVDHEMSVRGTIGSGHPYINDAGQVPEAPEGALIVDGSYSSLPLAQDTRTLVNEEHIRTTSVAFMTLKTTKDGKQGTQRELLNGAFVAIPSNREALVLSSKSVIAKRARAIGVKAIAGSLEAVQDRARDALQDAYPGAWVYLRATLPEGDGGVLVYCVENPDTYDSDEYKQSYLDDGSVITLTGERSAVDVMEVITPDPDEAAESGATKSPEAGASAPASGEKAAPAADATSVEITDDDLQAKALAIVAAQFIN